MATPLQDLRGFELEIGDVLRLPENYDLGPGSGPVDLLVFDPPDDDCGPGLMVVSGHKSGQTFCIFPSESRSEHGGLSAGWLLENWDQWFRFSSVDQPMPADGASVISSYSLLDEEEPYDPNQALENARDRMIQPRPAEIRILLAQPAGHFIEMTAIAPDIDLGRERILVSWLPYQEDGFELMTLYFNAKSWKTNLSFHSEHWKAISKEEPA
ncbi:Imm45 family immunity protein [Rhizobium herbae]|uniref:Immunity protein 45 domain-containing protein n=1 Tax=Rhizobium herbae TaxID=508661 RepID=A0ABS4EMH5_9HYPH|nr:Imm45 family immunity protein [Rhizobium herbae]MBP1859152.1 hypothetical protein [Rhizobium herbae]